MSGPALLAATDLRVDFDGAAAVEHATFQTTGSSVVTLGDGGALFAALSGAAHIRSGQLLFCGMDVGRREHARAQPSFGIAPCDPPLSGEWSALDYLVTSARLASLSSREAKRAAEKTLDALQLRTMARRRIQSLTLAERRGLVIAQATVTEPAVMVIASPFGGLEGPDAAELGRVLAAATAGRRFVAFAQSVAPGSEERSIAARAGEILLFSSGRFTLRAGLADLESRGSGYTMVLRGDVDAFAKAIAARGGRLEGGPGRYLALVPPQVSPNQLVELSLSVGAPILELTSHVVGPSPSMIQVEP